MKDTLLQNIVDIMASMNDKAPLDLTLGVAGFLITGRLINVEEYCEHNPITKSIFDHDKKSIIAKKTPSKNVVNEPKNPTKFIHLADAQYLTTDGKTIPTNNGVYIRVALEDVHSFVLGRTSTQNN